MKAHFDMPAVLNVAAYRFVAIDEIESLRTTLFERAEAVSLKGTILLAPEGINLFLAGEPTAVHRFLDELGRDARFTDLPIKESLSSQVPFKRLRVRIKREIIRMNHPAIRPVAGRAPAVAPEVLARWLDAGHDDEGRPVVMLDTRNAFEVDAGAFEGACDWRISRFSEFPEAFDSHRAELAGKTVVSYCTGGIRCEKAAIYMRQQMPDAPIYQLDGGILRYFEDMGGNHFRGDCFVFDERETLDADLSPRH